MFLKTFHLFPRAFSVYSYFKKKDGAKVKRIGILSHFIHEGNQDPDGLGELLRVTWVGNGNHGLLTLLLVPD